MTQDDKFDLRNLARIPLGLDGAQDAIRMAMLPSSGMICPRCGAEAKRLPDGNLSDSTWQVDPKTHQALGPMYHVACLQVVIAERDFAYVAEHLKPWTPKEELAQARRATSTRKHKDGGGCPSESDPNYLCPEWHFEEEELDNGVTTMCSCGVPHPRQCQVACSICEAHEFAGASNPYTPHPRRVWKDGKPVNAEEAPDARPDAR